MTNGNSNNRPNYIKITITGVITFFLINSISLLARGLFSKEMLGATISPLILTVVSIILGSRNLKTKRNYGRGLILGGLLNVAFWIYFFVALSIGLRNQ
jgi:hypothetical protein